MYLILIGAILVVVAVTGISIYLDERKLSSMSEEEQNQYIFERDLEYYRSLREYNKY